MVLEDAPDAIRGALHLYVDLPMALVDKPGICHRCEPRHTSLIYKREHSSLESHPGLDESGVAGSWLAVPRFIDLEDAVTTPHLIATLPSNKTHVKSGNDGGCEVTYHAEFPGTVAPFSSEP